MSRCGHFRPWLEPPLKDMHPAQVHPVVPGRGGRGRALRRRAIVAVPPPPAQPPPVPPRQRKAPIPKALREALWLQHFGKAFESKCSVAWCPNRITVYDFQAGHNVPESKGGATTLENLVPICSRCNLSMGSQYSIDEWNTLGASAGTGPLPRPPPLWARFKERLARYFRCFEARPPAVVAPPPGAKRPSKHAKK
jgi:hypothetical protein